MADLMNADVDLIFYDTTSLHFEVDKEDEIARRRDDREYDPLRKRGYSKNGREDAPQIVVGLAVTRDGLPVRSSVFSGDTADVTTVEKVKADLRLATRSLHVRGRRRDELRGEPAQLALGNGKYILGSRMRAGDEVTTDVLARQGRYQEVKDGLRVKEVIVGDGERRRRYVVCHNPDEEARQRAHREKLLAEVEAEIEAMKARPDRKHSKRTCALLTRPRRRADSDPCSRGRRTGATATAHGNRFVEVRTSFGPQVVVGYHEDVRLAELPKLVPRSSLRSSFGAVAVQTIIRCGSNGSFGWTAALRRQPLGDVVIGEHSARS